MCGLIRTKKCQLWLHLPPSKRKKLMNVNSSKLAGELKMNESCQFELNANENEYKLILHFYHFQICLFLLFRPNILIETKYIKNRKINSTLF